MSSSNPPPSVISTLCEAALEAAICEDKVYDHHKVQFNIYFDNEQTPETFDGELTDDCVTSEDSENRYITIGYKTTITVSSSKMLAALDVCLLNKSTNMYDPLITIREIDVELTGGYIYEIHVKETLQIPKSCSVTTV